MVSITALLHTKDDALRLGRALETLYACDHILVVDHGSRDATVRIARDYGATVVPVRPGALPADYFQSVKAEPSRLRSANPEWIFCLDPRESLTEKLAASLFEWKSESIRPETHAATAFSVFFREETADGWLEISAPQTRLVPQSWKLWNGKFPVNEPSAFALEGELLRFVFP